MKRAVAAGLAVALLAAPGRARAQELARCEQQVQAIHATLDDDARRTRVWTWSWMAIGTGLLVGQGAIAAVTSGDTRIEFAVGSAASVFIPGMLLAHPPAVLSDAQVLDARLDATWVDGRPGDPCLALPRARELMGHVVEDQKLATGWFAHTFIIGGNILLGLLLGVVFHDWTGAAKQTVGGSLVGEAQILTLPGKTLQARGLGVGGDF